MEMLVSTEAKDVLCVNGGYKMQENGGIKMSFFLHFFLYTFLNSI